MDIEIDYKIGVGGSATVVKKGMEFNFELRNLMKISMRILDLKLLEIMIVR